MMKDVVLQYGMRSLVLDFLQWLLVRCENRVDKWLMYQEESIII